MTEIFCGSKPHRHSHESVGTAIRMIRNCFQCSMTALATLTGTYRRSIGWRWRSKTNGQSISAISISTFNFYFFSPRLLQSLTSFSLSLFMKQFKNNQDGIRFADYGTLTITSPNKKKVYYSVALQNSSSLSSTRMISPSGSIS